MIFCLLIILKELTLVKLRLNTLLNTISTERIDTIRGNVFMVSSSGWIKRGFQDDFCTGIDLAFYIVRHQVSLLPC